MSKTPMCVVASHTLVLQGIQRTSRKYFEYSFLNSCFNSFFSTFVHCFVIKFYMQILFVLKAIHDTGRHHCNLLRGVPLQLITWSLSWEGSQSSFKQLCVPC